MKEVAARKMSELNFVTLTDDACTSEVIAMMRALYIEDAPAFAVDHRRFPLTIEFLLAEPSRGSVIVFAEGTALCGYAILIPYWSNEFGGTLLCVDELFVIPEARNREIGHQFFEFLARTRPFDAIAIALEVSPGNLRAQRLYESIGFRPRRNATLIRRLPERSAADGP
jgi:ribosomal protein S18 acetylase RimI-like enzyme